MSGRLTGKVLALHLGILALLFIAQFILPAYHHTNVARIMVLATYAVGYNILLGYTGLMSLGHAMFFAAGMYGAGLPIYYLQFGAIQAFCIGILLSPSGVSFLIVTMMFAQACFLAILYFNRVTLGDQGFILSKSLESVSLGSFEFAFADPAVKYNFAWLLFGGCFLLSAVLAGSPTGRVLIAVRENEERTGLLGYNTFKYKLLSLVISGGISGAAGACYALLFSYVGASFASILYSIYPILWTLLGGTGTTMGPMIGTGLMFYLVDIASGLTSSYLLVVGAVLVMLILWFPLGIMGAVRARWLPWLP
jgi:branched-chain amino acid transport system permease protein